VSLTRAMDCLNVPADAKIHWLAKYIGKLCRLLYITEIVRHGFLLAVLLVPVAFAQECARTIPLSVFNTAIELGSNELVPGLLQARTGRSQLRITSVEKIPTRRLLLLVDGSGSMAAMDKFWLHKSKATKTAEEVAEKFIVEILPRVPVAYGVFQEQLFVAAGFASDPRRLQEDIGNIKQKSLGARKKGTAIYDALAEGLLLFGETQPGDAILLITDGEDNLSKHSPKEIENNLKQSGVRFFVLLVSEHIFNPLDFQSRQALMDISRQTGGMVNVLDAENPAWGFDEATAGAAQDISSFLHLQLLSSYRLHAAAPESKKAQKWTLSLRADGDARWKEVKLSYPDRLEPCAVSMPRR
jgi:hypothetical protein